MKKLILLVCFVSTLHAAGEKPWTWRDSDRVEHSRAELDSILEEHDKWVQSGGTLGHRAELERADLHEADLTEAHLNGADLHEADLTGAKLTRADLHEADLTGAKLTGAHLYGADLVWADLVGADLRGAHLVGTNLIWADLYEADLTGADLYGADLRGADLRRVYLTDTLVSYANFAEAIYQPWQDPPASSIALARGLGYLKWSGGGSEPIYALRRSLVDAGFIDSARQVNAAIHRHNQGSWEQFLFDWTCEWGANWLRPLIIAGVLSLLCTLIYWVGMHFQTKSGLYLAATGERVTTAKGKERIFRIAVGPTRKAPESSQLELGFEPKPQTKESSTPKLRQLRQRLGWEMTALGTAFLFSLMSVFNIGFREFNFGRWIRMLQPREFDIRARGWMRTVSGIQSLIGVALVALSLISYFGHPFD